MTDGAIHHAQAIQPPKPPTDLIASALLLPLHAINQQTHQGKKIRTTGQILAFDVKTSLLLLASSPSSSTTSHTPTLLVNLTVPLLAYSPAATDITGTSDSSWGYTFQARADVPQAPTRLRPRLRIERGEWVTVVGWLEGTDERASRKVKRLQSYDQPLELVLEAIHVAQSRAPPVDAVYRGQL